MGLGPGPRGPGLGLGPGPEPGLGLGREHTQELLSVSKRPLLAAELHVGARNRLLGKPRRSRLRLSWPFTRRRGASMRQRRKRPDGGRHQRGGRRRCYATICRARSNSHLLLGHRLAG
eukprot:scaffold84938_cov60-Phaeocystis_antarctica.AAC.1